MLSVIVSPSTIFQLSDLEVDPNFITLVIFTIVFGLAISFWLPLLCRFISFLISLFKR